MFTKVRTSTKLQNIKLFNRRFTERFFLFKKRHDALKKCIQIFNFLGTFCTSFKWFIGMNTKLRFLSVEESSSVFEQKPKQTRICNWKKKLRAFCEFVDILEAPTRHRVQKQQRNLLGTLSRRVMRSLLNKKASKSPENRKWSSTGTEDEECGNFAFVSKGYRWVFPETEQKMKFRWFFLQFCTYLGCILEYEGPQSWKENK